MKQSYDGNLKIIFDLVVLISKSFNHEISLEQIDWAKLKEDEEQSCMDHIGSLLFLVIGRGLILVSMHFCLFLYQEFGGTQDHLVCLRAQGADT